LDAGQVGAGAEVPTGACEHKHARVGGSVDRSQQLIERRGADGVATFTAVDRDEDDRATPLGVNHVSSITAMTSPSCTWSSGATRSSATVPETGASTGISIFIDSRITSSSPSATIWPTSARTCHTFAVISASTSTMRCVTLAT